MTSVWSWVKLAVRVLSLSIPFIKLRLTIQIHAFILLCFKLRAIFDAEALRVLQVLNLVLVPSACGFAGMESTHFVLASMHICIVSGSRS